MPITCVSRHHKTPLPELDEKHRDVLLFEKSGPDRQEFGTLESPYFCGCHIFRLDLWWGKENPVFWWSSRVTMLVKFLEPLPQTQPLGGSGHGGQRCGQLENGPGRRVRPQHVPPFEWRFK